MIHHHGYEAVIAAILDKAYKNEESKYIYRGHTNDAWLLESSYLRYCLKRNTGFSPLEAEELYAKFINKASDFLNQDLSKMDRWDQIALAQHHGVPTLFLDWTHSPYIALFFAVYEKLRTSHQGPIALWSLLIDDLDKKDSSSYFFYETKVFNTRRLVHQQGCFTYLPFEDDLGSFLTEEKSEAYRLNKYTVNVEGVEYRILKDLSLMGITQGFLFNDLDYIANDITNVVK